MRTILRTFASLALVVATSASAASIWFGDAAGNFSRLDTATNQVAAQMTGVAPKDAAMVPDGSVWVLGQGRFKQFSAAGTTLFDQSLATDNLTGARVVARDRYSAHLWVGDVVDTGSSRLVVELDPLGARLGSFASPGGIRAIAVDLDPTIWLLTNSQLLHYTPNGVLLGSVDLHAIFAGTPGFMAVDGIRNVVWIAGGTQVAAFDGHALGSPTHVITLPESAMGIDVDAQTGALWVATVNGLRTYGADASLVQTINTSSLGFASPQTVAFDPASNKAWLGYTGGVAAFARDGTLSSNVPLGQTVIRVATTAFIPSPSVSITAPANAAVFTAPASFTLAASATELGAAIAKVEFFRGATSLGMATTTPYQVSVTNLAAGSYSFTAVATDVHGTSTTSSAVSVISNAPPTVSITSPANNAVAAAPATITVTANAADSDGTVAKVDFYQGAALIGTATSAPYSASTASLGAGTYTFTAVATDNLGASTTSAAVSVIVDAPPTVSIASPANNSVIAAPGSVTITANAADSDGTVAKVDFYQGATLIATATSAPYTATTGSLASGTYNFTAVATDNVGLATTSAPVTVIADTPPTVALTAPANNAVVTAPGTVNLAASASDSDGTVAKVDFYQGPTLVGTSTSAPYAATVANLAAGTYTFTAVATDDRALSTTSAPITVIVNAPPTVAITSPADGAVVGAPATVSVTANAADSDGTVAKVEFLQGGAVVATVTGAPYATTLALAAGSYVLTARATDDRGAQTTSSAVTILVHAAPTVAMTSPANGATFRAPATIALAATAAASDGAVAKVEFFQGATLIATVTAAPYTFSWTNVAAGSYVLTAKVTDDRGFSTTSAPINVTVSAQLAIFYLHTDHLGTPRAITQSTDNQVVWKWDNTESFGNSAPNENPSGSGGFTYNLRFRGQYLDQETGITYNYFRDYDAKVGRYFESDMIGLKGGLNTYLYVLANPLRHTDSRGLDAYDDWPPNVRYDFQPNGNLYPGFTPQDGVCTLPGPIGTAANSNRCILKCCQVHDECFDKHLCNASSWVGNVLGVGRDCQRCNSEAAGCIGRAISKGCSACDS